MPAEVILQHGWGLSAKCWDGWRSRLQGANVLCMVAERGYFGDKYHEPRFSRYASRRILVVHSLGLHMVDDDLLDESETIIAFGSFLHFHPDGEDRLANKRSRRTVRAMYEKLNDDPTAVLSQFWSNCQHPPELLPDIKSGEIDAEMLQDDLFVLDHSAIDASALDGKRVIVVHGEFDKVVPLPAAQALAAGNQRELKVISGAGHALPFTDPDLGFSILQAQLPPALTMVPTWQPIK